MIITITRREVSAEAVKNACCVNCGTTLRGQIPFTAPVLGDKDDAVRKLLDAVEAWRAQPVCCVRCPERLAVTP